MNPKVILSSRNLLTGMIITAFTAVLFAGTWIIYNEFSEAAAGDASYVPSDGQGASQINIEFASAANDIDNVIACPGGLGFPAETICYGPAETVVTELAGGLNTGITVANISAIARTDTIGGSDTVVTLIFDQENALTDSTQTTLTVTNLGGRTATFNNIIPKVGGPAVEYFQSNPNMGNKTTFRTGPLIESDPITTTDQTVTCPVDPIYDGQTCIALANVEFTNAAGLAGDASIEAAIIDGPGDNEITVVMNGADKITDDQDLELTIHAFNNVSDWVSDTFTLDPSAGGDPPPPTGTGSYFQDNSKFAVTTLTFPPLVGSGSITTDGLTTACPADPAYDSETCLNTNVVTIANATGLSTSTIQAVIIDGDLDNTYTVILDAADAVTNPGAIEIQAEANNNVAEVLISNWAEEQEPPVLSHSYNNTNSVAGNNTTVTIQLPQQPDGVTNVVACDGAITGYLEASPECYDTATITLDSGFAPGATLLGAVRGDFVTGVSLTQNDLFLVFDGADQVTGATPLDIQVSLANTGGITGSYTNITNAGSTPPPGGTMTYMQSDASWGNRTTLQGPLTDGEAINSSGQEVACPDRPEFGSATCIDETLGTLADAGGGLAGGATIEAIAINPSENSAIVVIMDTENAISDDTQLELTISTFNNVSEKLFDTFEESEPPAPQLNGTYWPGADSGMDGNGIVIITLDEELDGATNTTPCETGYESRTCYAKAAVTHSDDTGLESGITDSNILMIMQDDQNASQLIVIYDTADAINDTSQVEITIANTIGGLSGERVCSNITTGQPPATGEYVPMHEGIAGTSVMILPSYQGTISTITCDADVESMIEPFSLGTVVCTDPTLITDLSGSDLKPYITTSDIWALIRMDTFEAGEGSDKKLAIIFNQPEVAYDTNNLSVTVGSGENAMTVNTWTWTGSDTYEPMMISSGEDVWLQMVQPPWYSQVATNLQTIQLVYSGPVNGATVTSNNITLKDSQSNAVSLTFKKNSLEDGRDVINVNFAGGLTNSEIYTLSIEGLKDGNGTDLPAEYFEYYADSSLNPSEATQIEYTSVENGETDVDPMIWEIMIAYDDAIGSTGSGAMAISPAVSAFSYEFDPEFDAYRVLLQEPLLEDTEYTLSIYGAAITDVYGFNVADYDLVFTTGTASSDSPILTWFDPVVGYEQDGTVVGGIARVGFNIRLNSNAKDSDNWMLTCDGSPVSLKGLGVEYYSEDYFLEIINAPIPPTANSCTLQAVTDNDTPVKGLNGVAFDGTDNEITAQAYSESSYYSDGEDWAFGGCIVE